MRVKHGSRCEFKFRRSFEFCLHKIKHGRRNLKRKCSSLFGVPSHNSATPYVMWCSDVVKLARNADVSGLFRKHRTVSHLHEPEIQNDASAIFRDLLSGSPYLTLASLYSLHDPAQINRIWKVWPVQLGHLLVNREACPFGCCCERARVRSLSRALRTKNNVYLCHKPACPRIGRENYIGYVTPCSAPAVPT